MIQSEFDAISLNDLNDYLLFVNKGFESLILDLSISELMDLETEKKYWR